MKNFHYGALCIFIMLSEIGVQNTIFAQTSHDVEIGKKVTFLAPQNKHYHYFWQVDKGDGFKDIAESETDFIGKNKHILEIKEAKISMNKYHFRCKINILDTTVYTIKVPDNKTKKSKDSIIKITKEIPVTNDAIDTLSVFTKIEPLNGIIKVGDKMTLNTSILDKYIAKYNIQWKEIITNYDINIAGETKPSFTFTATCTSNNLHQYKYVAVDKEGYSIESKPIKIIVTGCITEINNNQKSGKSTSFAVSADTSGASFQWQVKRHRNGEFEEITNDDSTTYSGFDEDTLVIKATNHSMYNNEYRCIISYSKPPMQIISDTATLLINDRVAEHKNRIDVTAAMYSGIKGVQDDNSSSLTQFYARSNFFFKDDGIDINAHKDKRYIWLRNIFTQYTYTTNADPIKYLNLADTTKNTPQNNANKRGVNRLDLLQNSNHNFTVSFPVLTFIAPEYRKPKLFGDLLHIYFEPYIGFLITRVDNSKLTDTSYPLNVWSMQYGMSIGARTQLKSPFVIESQLKLFQISVLSNSINPGLNFQENKVLNDLTSSGKSLTSKTNPLYICLDELIIYNTGKDGNQSNVFIHFNWYTNFANITAVHPYTNFFQLQGGYALDIVALLNKLK